MRNKTDIHISFFYDKINIGDTMSKIELIQGSCIDQEVDAIVNAANGYMMHGGGIARAILLKAGVELNKACQEYDLPIKDGKVIITPAFNIKNAKAIIHAVGPNFTITPKAIDKLFDAYYNSLLKLKENNYHSIAFPLISSGIFSGNIENPVALSTFQCIKAYDRFIKENNDYDINVLLCAFTDDEYIEAENEFNNYN